MKRKKKSKFKRLNIKRVVFCLALIILFIYLIIRGISALIKTNKDIASDLPFSINSIFTSSNDTPKYTVIREDTNSNYSGKRSRKSF